MLDSERVLADVEEKIGYPVIVKPVNLGSSVGISKAVDRAALRDALDLAFGFAPRVLVERAVEHLREINAPSSATRKAPCPSVCEEAGQHRRHPELQG